MQSAIFEAHKRTANLVNQAQEILRIRELLDTKRILNESVGNSFNVDMVNTDTECIIYCEVPGVKKEDISISFENPFLKIKADRTLLEEKEGFEYISREIERGKIEKIFRISSILDPERTSAELENGILTLKIPKKKAEKNQIEIKIK